MSTTLWQLEQDDHADASGVSAKPGIGANTPLYRPEVLKTIEATVDGLSAELRVLSLDIHAHPELKFEEHHAHDVMTAFLSSHGFEVTHHYLLPTAWRATFTHRLPSADGSRQLRTIGINSEMDALPGVGHACGHNLIAIAGVAVACAVKAAMEEWDIEGKVELLGTPAEEGGSGKVLLLDQGAYKDMDVCLMCHPAPGPQASISLSSSLALQEVTVEFVGHTAHAALSPWEGQNALDAAVLAYTNVSLLRQQLKPTDRVHGVIQSHPDRTMWVPNIIPDYAMMRWYIRAPTWAGVQATLKRLEACFTAAALATGCTCKIEHVRAVTELRQNEALGKELTTVVVNRYGHVDYEWGIKSASTDFGTITYALPSLHPGFAIPTRPNGGNHTFDFAASAATPVAHEACLDVSKALAATGIRVLCDDTFFEEVRQTFEEDKKRRADV